MRAASEFQSAGSRDPGAGEPHWRSSVFGWSRIDRFIAEGGKGPYPDME
jgi:hypothetical protein